MSLRIKNGVLVDVAESKFGNRKTEFAGETYHSKREADYAAELNLRLRGGDIAEWVRQVPIPLVVNEHKIGTYVMDFAIKHNDGSLEWIEVKGHETAVFKLKWKLLEALHPDVKKTIVR